MAGGNIIGVMTNFFDAEQIIFDTCEISLENNFSLLTQYMSVYVYLCTYVPFSSLCGRFSTDVLSFFSSCLSFAVSLLMFFMTLVWHSYDTRENSYLRSHAY